MHVFREFETVATDPVGLGIRISLVTRAPGETALAKRLGELGTVQSMPSSVAEALLIARGEDLIVIDCDSTVAPDVAQRMLDRVRAKGMMPAPVLLVSSQCTASDFADDPAQPTLLRAPLSRIALRVGAQHALRLAPSWAA